MKNLQEVLNAENLTVYGASQIIAAEADEKLEILQKQITRHLHDTPWIDSDLEHVLLMLDYEVTISKIVPR
jgi:hypothetical protein